uniref:Uncharacterized protein n=1 Tax=Anguilla anguilla TaxID=7936 RepID=A0A0E9TNT8_ANGAN
MAFLASRPSPSAEEGLNER